MKLVAGRQYGFSYQGNSKMLPSSSEAPLKPSWVCSQHSGGHCTVPSLRMNTLKYCPNTDPLNYSGLAKCWDKINKKYPAYVVPGAVFKAL